MAKEKFYMAGVLYEYDDEKNIYYPVEEIIKSEEKAKEEKSKKENKN